MAHSRKKSLLWVVHALFFGTLFYLPLAKILGVGIHRSIFSSVLGHDVFGVLWFTIWQAALSTLIAILFGIPGAYIFYRVHFPGQRWVKTLITIPFMLPSIVVAIGFTTFHGLASIVLIIAANIFMNYALAVRVIGGSWINLDHDLDEAAQLDGANKLQIFSRIQLPQLKEAISSAAGLIFLYCAANFGIVLVLGDARTNTLETEIYTSAIQYLNIPRATSLVLIQTILTISVFTFVQSMGNSTTSLFGRVDGKHRKRVGVRDLPAILATLPPILLITIPLIRIISKVFQGGLTNFRALGGTGSQNYLSISILQAGENSLRNAVITALISIIAGTISAYLLCRVNGRLGRGLEMLMQLPLGISSVVIGLGYLLCFSSGIFPLRSSWLVTAIAESIIATPLVIRLAYPALRAIDLEIREAAAMDGATDGDTWWFIDLPIIRNILLIAFGYAALISVGDFGAANFLAYGQQGTLTTTLYQLISKPGAANYGMAMATSFILIMVTSIVIASIGE